MPKYINKQEALEEHNCTSLAELEYHSSQEYLFMYINACICILSQRINSYES
jgi:hypothetical protein